MTMSTDQVCGKLANGGVDEATIGRVFAARLQPDNLDDPEHKFCLGVPAPGGQAFLVVYKFGEASQFEPEEHHWIPKWLSVEGPFSMKEAEAKAKELTKSA